MYKAVIFDLDGTLVHSSLDFAAIRRDINCPTGIDILDFVSELSEPEQRCAQTIIEGHELSDAEATYALPGAQALVTKLSQQGFKTGIVTRNSRQATQIKLAQTGIQVDAVLTREDSKPKPDPEALLRLSEQWQLSPNECVYIGDYLYDLQAARNAGMCAGLYLADANKSPSFLALADFVLNHWEDLNERISTA